MRIFKNNEGASLAEAMVALGLVMVGLIGMIALYTRSLSLNRNVVNQTIAAGLAAEGIEVVKNMIDANVAERGSREWTARLPEGTFAVDYATVLSAAPLPDARAPLAWRNAEGRYANGGGSETLFTRRVTIAFPSVSETQVNSIVEWTEAGEEKSVNVEDRFYQWRP